jgi:hypothetical protein
MELKPLIALKVLFTINNLKLIVWVFKIKENIANNYKPSVLLFRRWVYNSTLIGQSYKNFGNSVGFNLSIPIYDGNQRQLQTKKRISIRN